MWHFVPLRGDPAAGAAAAEARALGEVACPSPIV